MSKTTYKSDNVRTIAAVGVFSALAYICCVLFHFKLMFLTFDLKDAVMTVGAMLLGPIYGLAMAVIVALIEAVTISGTGIYGFIMNIIASCAFVCIGSLIYSRKRTMGGAVIGMLASIIGMTAVMMVANLTITPFYMGTTIDKIVEMIPTVLMPFNLTKAIFNASLVFLLYKPLSGALKAAGFFSHAKGSPAESSMIPDKKKNYTVNLAVTLISIVIAVLTLVYFFLVLEGSFSFN